MRIPLDGVPAVAPAQELVARSLAWQPPSLPGLAPGTVRRWTGMATWQPPESVVLARHRALDRPHWIVSNRRDPPEGYVLEFDLGLVQRNEQPGTARLVGADGGFALEDPATAPAEGAEVLGQVEQAPFPMMEVLELRRVPETRQLVLVAGAADPLSDTTEPVRTLGWLESFPILPRRITEQPLPPYRLSLLVRRSDHATWRHSYERVAFDAREPSDAATLALGSMWTRPATGFVPLWREADGRLASALLTPSPATSSARARAVPRWVAAPVAWERRPRAWALRAAASRTRHLAADRTPPSASARESLGHLRATPAPGYGALYSARHPVLRDQFITRSALEARDMGYEIEGILGYAGDLGADRHRGPREILWGSRFGHQRRYVEDEPGTEPPATAPPAPAPSEDDGSRVAAAPDTLAAMGVARARRAARRLPAAWAALHGQPEPAPEPPAAPPAAEEPVHTRFPLGHYYSPVYDPRELAEEPRRSQIWPPTPRETPGIDWREDEQAALCTGPFAEQERLRFIDEESDDPSEYFTSNDQYPALDAWALEAMIRHHRPKRFVEVGSGFSSLVTARVNREHFDGAIDFVCVEPYPRQFLLDGVPGITGLRVEKVQDTPLEVFTGLGAGDILFVDTSHVVKTGGDVPWIYNQILPRLAPGVVVHMHDVCLPGDYPPAWVLDGWGWNETYLVHAFLTYNAGFAVRFSSPMMVQRQRYALLAAFPEYVDHEARAGSSLWIQRI